MITLLDYRRSVSELYHAIRGYGTHSEDAHTLFKTTRDDLFKTHPQSPLDSAQKSAFNGLSYYPYDPAYRVVIKPKPLAEPQIFYVDLGDDGQFTMRQFAEVDITLPTGSGTLGVFWIEGYGGGVFIPFRDTTNDNTTYGGGRYVLDTIKGADLGSESGEDLVLDFNYAYHPSCYYNPRWVCPLAPPSNRLSFPVTAGEKLMILEN